MVCKIFYIILAFISATGSAWAGGEAVRENDPLTENGFLQLIKACAPTVDPSTMSAIVSAESRGNQFAIADAGLLSLPWAQRKSMVRSFYFGTVEESVEKAEQLLSIGHTVSLGLAQINDRNLKKYGLSIRDTFDPCKNIATGGKIITEFYAKAVRQFGEGKVALNAALLAYNQGYWHGGDRDGYVKLVYQQANRRLILQTKAVNKDISHAGGVQPIVANPGHEFKISAREFSLE